MSLNPLLKGLAATHPGEILADVVLPALKTDAKVTKVAFAQHLHMTRAALDNILKGETSITPPTALRLGKLVGPNAEFWTTLQANYDLARAREALGAEIDQLPTLTAA